MNPPAEFKESSDIIVIEDDSTIRAALEKLLTRDGYRTICAGSIEQAMTLIASHRPSIALLDLSLPDGDGVRVIKSIMSQGVGEVIVISGTDNVEKTQRCLEAGVFDFIIKPARSNDVLRSVHRADASRRLRLITDGDYPTQLKPGFGALEGLSGTGKTLIRRIKTLSALSPGHVLITGQSGVLKADNAALIHQFSGRTGPALLIDCASEIDQFALDRFTGRVETSSHDEQQDNIIGYLGKAHRGTLVLDDLSSLPMAVQRVLAKYIESGEILPVDSLTTVAYQCSIIGILRETPEKALSRGTLYEPLYYALVANNLQVPPLVDRRMDIELFARSAVRQLNAVFDTEKSLSSDLVEQLKSHFWPGNLIELKNCLLTAYRKTEPGEEIQPIHALSGSVAGSQEKEIAPFIGKTFKEVEAQLIKATLESCNNNKSQCARVLGVSLKTLYNRLSAASNI